MPTAGRYPTIRRRSSPFSRSATRSDRTNRAQPWRSSPVGGEVGDPPSGDAHPVVRTPRGATVTHYAQRPVQESHTYENYSGWGGWVVFAGILMILLGAFQAIEGLVALFNEQYF